MSIRNLLLAFLAISVLASCNKDEDPLSPEDQLALDIQIIEDYLAAEGLVAEKTASGLHYIITKTGNGVRPDPTSTVEVKYTGYLPDKTVFDATRPASTIKFPLDGVIAGWTEGLQLLESGGGEGTLLIPSYLGYGGDPPSSRIPEHAVLIFDITLIGIE